MTACIAALVIGAIMGFPLYAAIYGHPASSRSIKYAPVRNDFSPPSSAKAAASARRGSLVPSQTAL